MTPLSSSTLLSWAVVAATSVRPAWAAPPDFPGAPASDGLAVPPPTPQIFDGIEATRCQWPTQAMLEFVGCSATLVSPWIVTTAAHCVDDVDDPGNVLFGESWTSPARREVVEYCRRNPDYTGLVDGSDIAFCKLHEPIYDHPVTPVVYGCETEMLQPGREVWIVGVGIESEDGSFGTKRMGQTVIVAVDESIAGGEGIQIGDAAHNTCNGDSGGPAFLQYPDGSWHVFGVTSGGPLECSGHPDTFTPIHPWVPWIEETSGIDITPCHDVDGTWDPTGWCQGFEMDPFDDGDWDAFCLGEVSAASASCGAAFDAAPDTEPPMAQFTSPADGMIYDVGPVTVPLEIAVDDGDGWGVRSVRLSINGAVQDVEFREPPYRASAEFPKGAYELVAIAEDFAGNLGESAVLRIAVDAELPPLPPEGTSTSGGSSNDDGTDDDGAQDTTHAALDDTGDGSSGEAPALEGGSGGCGCATAPRPGLFGPAGLLLALGARRRRRPAASRALPGRGPHGCA